MMKEIVLRCIIGGIVVSSFAVLGELFKPKSFAGLFEAIPSVALATLGLTVARLWQVVCGDRSAFDDCRSNRVLRIRFIYKWKALAENQTLIHVLTCLDR